MAAGRYHKARCEQRPRARRGATARSAVFRPKWHSKSLTSTRLFAPPAIRRRVVGLFHMAMLGLRAGSGLTVGLMGAFIGVRYSLAVSSFAVVLVSVALFVRDARARTALSPESEITSVGM